MSQPQPDNQNISSPSKQSDQDHYHQQHQTIESHPTSAVATPNPQTEALNRLQQDYEKQKQSMATLHEHHTRRVHDLEQEVKVLRQKEDEYQQHIDSLSSKVKELEAKYDTAHVEFKSQVAEEKQNSAQHEKECDGKVLALQQGLNEVLAQHASEMAKINASLLSTRTLLVKERVNTWHLPKVVSDAVHEALMGSVEHIRALESQITAANAELRAWETEAARLRSNVSELSHRISESELASKTALLNAQKKAEELQLGNSQLAMLNRTLEGRLAMAEEEAAGKVASEIETLRKEVVNAQKLRAAAESMLETKIQAAKEAEDTLNAERDAKAKAIGRYKEDAWLAKVQVTALTQQYNDAVRSLSSELSSETSSNLQIIAQRDAEISALQQEVKALSERCAQSNNERISSMEKEIAVLRQQLQEKSRPRESSTRGTPSKRPHDDTISPEEENAQLKASLQSLQMDNAIQKQQAEATLAEVKYSTAATIEKIRKEASSSASEAQRLLHEYRKEASAATNKTSVLESKVKELESELKSLTQQHNKAQAKIVLLESNKAVETAQAVAAQQEAESDSPARKKPASRRKEK